VKTLFAFIALLIIVDLSGCQSVVPKPGLSPVDQPRVAPCQSIGNARNGFTIGGISLGGLGSGAAIAGASLPSTDMGVKTGLVVGAAIATGLAMTSGTIAAFLGTDFSAAQCSEVVGDLPPAPPMPVAPSGATVTVIPPDAGAAP